MPPLDERYSSRQEYAEVHDENYDSYEYYEDEYDEGYEHYDPDELDPSYDGY